MKKRETCTHKSCECVKKINALLLEKNGRIVGAENMMTGNVSPSISIEKIDRSDPKKPPKWIASNFCPFCGVRLR